jgi:hypothetical protein
VLYRRFIFFMYIVVPEVPISPILKPPIGHEPKPVLSTSRAQRDVSKMHLLLLSISLSVLQGYVTKTVRQPTAHPPS